MKTQDVILQLMKRLPVLSPFFSQQLAIASVTKIGSVAEVVTTIPHNLAVNNIVSAANILTPTAIASFTQTATEIEFTTVTNNDLTLNTAAPLDQNQQVRITSLLGFNAVYTLKKSLNRKKFVVVKAGQPALPADPLFLQEPALIGYNGLKAVTLVPNPTTFRYALDFDLPQPNYLTGAFIATGIRVSGACDFQTMVNSYTVQPSDNVWACVVLDEYNASKDRRTLNDAITQQGQQMDFIQQVLAQFSVYIIIPNKGDILTKTNGRAARDMVEDIRAPLFRSLLGIDFGSDLSCPGQGVVAYLGDSFVSYNGAVYIHQFVFQQVLDITFGDTAIQTFDRAFRDIDLSIRNQFSDLTVYTAGINLDEQP